MTDEIRLEFKSRTGIDVPNEFRIKRSSKIRLKTTIREHLGVAKTTLENNYKNSIFEFDFDPKEYNGGNCHGQKVFAPYTKCLILLLYT